MLPRSDEALYQRLLDGDLAAFDELYERYERHLFGFIRQQLDDSAEAEDVLHEAFMSVLRERNAGRAARSFKAWLFQVTHHLCLNRLRSKARAAKAMTEVATVPPAEGSHPERALEQHQAAAALRVAVAKLPTALAELYQLRSGGLSYDELAEALAVPLGTVKSRMHELVSRLRKELQP